MKRSNHYDEILHLSTSIKHTLSIDPKKSRGKCRVCINYNKNQKLSWYRYETSSTHLKPDKCYLSFHDNKD